MKTATKLVACVAVLCGAIVAFELDAKEGTVLTPAQKQFADDVFSYAQQGKKIGPLLSKKYDGQYLPVSEKKDAFREAMKTYFALESNPKYLDYNKMVQFYEKNLNSWEGQQMEEWAHEKDVSYAIYAFRHKEFLESDNTVLGTVDSRKSYVFLGLYLLDEGNKMEKMYKEAAEIYHDKRTYYQFKWHIFWEMIMINALHNDKYLWLSDPDFWKKFAITPVESDATMKAQKKNEVRKGIRDYYQYCVKNAGTNKFPQASASGCEKIRSLAEQYGYWSSPEEEAKGALKATISSLFSHSKR